jgi:hypothetical protein
MRRFPNLLLVVSIACCGCRTTPVRPPNSLFDGGQAPDGLFGRSGETASGDTGGSLDIASSPFPPTDAAPTELSPPPTDAAISFVEDSGSGQDSASTADTSGEASGAGSCGSEISFQIDLAPNVDPNSLCTLPCDGVSVSVTSGSIQLWLGFVATMSGRFVWTGSTQQYFRGAATCETCANPPSVSCPGGIATFPSTRIARVWSGEYFAIGPTCDGKPCINPAVCALPGHYTAAVCATQGLASGGHCTPSEGTICSTVEFDLPSTVALSVELGL